MSSVTVTISVVLDLSFWTIVRLWLLPPSLRRAFVEQWKASPRRCIDCDRVVRGDR